MEPFYIQTDLPPNEIKRLIECAKDHGKRAVEQHRDAVREAVEVINKMVGLFEGSMSNPGVGIMQLPAEKALFKHAVFLVENAGSEESYEIPRSRILVTTVPFVRFPKPGVSSSGYRTTGESYVPDPELGALWADVLTPREFEEAF